MTACAMNVLVTNAASPTFMVTYHSLRMAFGCRIVGLSKCESYATHLLDRQYLQKGSLLEDAAEVCRAEKIDLIIPHKIEHRLLFLENRGLFGPAKILSAPSDAITAAEDKLGFLSLCAKNNVPVPTHHVASSIRELRESVALLGYPWKKVVVKPVRGSGSRGLRILNRNVNFRRLFTKKRPDYPEITLSNLHRIIGDRFEKLLVMEYLPGKEYSVDCLRQDGTELCLARQRLQTMNGLTTVGVVERHAEIEQHSKSLSLALGLETVFGFQFREDEGGRMKVLECNPRIQGTMIMSALAGANIIAASAAMLLGRKPPEFDVDYGMKFYRIYSGIAVGRQLTKLTL